MNPRLSASALAVILCALSTTGLGADNANLSLDRELRITVMGDIEDLTLIDPLSRSTRDSSGTVLGDIPDCILTDATKDDDDLPKGQENRTPRAMLFEVPAPLSGIYRLSGRTHAKTSVSIEADHLCSDRDEYSGQWGGVIQGRAAWKIVVSGESDSCGVYVQKLPVTRRRSSPLPK